MIFLQLSAATGPEECCLAVAKAFAYLSQEAAAASVRLDCIEHIPGTYSGTFRSLLLALEGAAAQDLAQRWQGSVQWICSSPYRPGHRRKNWFIGADIFAADNAASAAQEVCLDRAIRYEAMRASGPGGQHVNKTDSAIRATHIPSGLSVKVQTERSQHANKRLARNLLTYKLVALAQEAQQHNRAARRAQHHGLERGNAGRVFVGERFQLRT